MADQSQLKFISPAEALSGQRAGLTTVIDVRKPEEWEEIRIKEAVHVPLPQFLDTQQLDVVIKDTVQKIEGQVCLTCFQCIKRGPAAATALIARMQELGLDTERVCVLKGGVEAVQQNPELQGNLEGTSHTAVAQKKD